MFLSVFGFGRGNLNDQMMQTIAQNGNGTAAYIDTLAEAEKVLVEDASPRRCSPIAKDVKIQVEFNPAKVAEYRLIGYETRALNREDFNNDRVDAGEIGSGHSVTAIYEITPKGSPATMIDDLRYGEAAVGNGGVANAGEYAFVKIRYKAPDGDVRKLITTPVTEANEVSSLRPGRASTSASRSRSRLSARSCANTDQTAKFGYDKIMEIATAARGADPFGYRAEFLSLVRLASALEPVTGSGNAGMCLVAGRSELGADRWAGKQAGGDGPAGLVSAKASSFALVAFVCARETRRSRLRHHQGAGGKVPGRLQPEPWRHLSDAADAGGGRSRCLAGRTATSGSISITERGRDLSRRARSRTGAINAQIDDGVRRGRQSLAWERDPRACAWTLYRHGCGGGSLIGRAGRKGARDTSPGRDAIWKICSGRAGLGSREERGSARRAKNFAKNQARPRRRSRRASLVSADAPLGRRSCCAAGRCARRSSRRSGAPTFVCASSALRIAARWANDVPQQPPTIFAPRIDRQPDIVGHQFRRAGIVDLGAAEFRNAAIALDDDRRIRPAPRSCRAATPGCRRRRRRNWRRRRAAASARPSATPWMSLGSRPIIVRPAVSNEPV